MTITTAIQGPHCPRWLPIGQNREDGVMHNRLRTLALLLFVIVPAAADPLSDLRATVQRYPANGPFLVSALLRVSGDSKGVAGARTGSTTFEAEVGPRGLMIRVPPSALGQAEEEAEKKKRNAENLTPTRTALAALPPVDGRDLARS